MIKNSEYNHPIITAHKISFLKEKVIDCLLKKEMNLSFPQYAVLLFCDLFPCVSQQKIAEFRNCTEASVSKTIKLMMNKGFLTRKGVKGDKRKNEIKLTTKGNRLLKRAKMVVKKEFDLLCSSLTKTEYKNIGNLLDKVFERVLLRAEDLKIIKNKEHIKIHPVKIPIKN